LARWTGLGQILGRQHGLDFMQYLKYGFSGVKELLLPDPLGLVYRIIGLCIFIGYDEFSFDIAVHIVSHSYCLTGLTKPTY